MPPTLPASWVCSFITLLYEKVDLEFSSDVISIEKSGEHFRLLYDVKGRFAIHRITPEEATYKLLKVRRVAIGTNAVPHIVTHDGRTIRYPDPAIKVNDTVKYDFEQGKITDFVKFDTGNIVMVTGGRNMGRAGIIMHREKHVGGFDIVHVKDSLDRTFATRYVYSVVFTLTSSCYLIVSPTSSSLEKVSSPGYPCPKAKVSSLPFQRREMPGEEELRNSKKFRGIARFPFFSKPCMYVLYIYIFTQFKILFAVKGFLFLIMTIIKSIISTHHQ